MANSLTGKQEDVLRVIIEFSNRNSYPPTVREIAFALGLSSPATVASHLSALERKGYIKRSSSKQRAIEVLKRPADLEVNEPNNAEVLNDYDKDLLEIPLIGTITAGQPIFAEENFEEYFPLPANYVHASNPVFMLRISGESMIEAGILDGDLIIVEQVNVVRNGEIAAVLINDSATVKYFYKEAGYYRLQPANSTMEPIIVDKSEDVRILGKVVGLYREF